MYISSYSDPTGNLYCVKIDDVAHGSTLKCTTCPFFRGSIQGAGRECEVGDDGEEIAIRDPYEYMNSKDKTSGDVDATPVS